MRTLIAVPTVLLAVLAAVAGCGEETSDGDTRAQDPSETESSSESPSRSPSESPSTEAPEPQPGMTAPGAELALGETATVPVRTFQDPIGGTAEITVNTIEPVSAADAEAAGYTGDGAVFLVRSEARLTEVSQLRIFDPSVDLVAMSGTDIATPLDPEQAAGLDCEAESDPSPERGSELTVCQAVEAPAGAAVDRVLFAPYAGDYSVTDGAPLTWAE